FHTPDARTELVRSYGIQAYCCHPLRARDRLIGTLSFGTKTRARFTPEEVELMRTVADQVAIALQRIQARQELAEAHQILQLALNAGGMGTWAWDLRTNRSTWNPQEYRLLGLPAGSGAADTELFFRQVHPEDAPALREAIGDAVAHSSVLEQEFRILRADDGQVRWLSSMGSVVRDEEGQPTALMGISYDITDRRNREEELRKLNRTLRAMSNSSQALIRAEEEAAYLDEVCRIIVADCGYAMVWIGYAENDEAKTIRPVSHAGFEDGYLETLHLTWADTERGRGPTGTAIRTGKPSKCTDMLSDPRFTPWREEALRRGYASSMVLPLLSDGNAFGAVTIYSKRPDPFSEEEEKLLTELADDLTYGITAIRLRLENRKAQEALSESEKRFRELSDAMPQLVWTAEPDGRVDYFNRRITEFKYDRGATPVIHPEDLPLTVKTWQRGLNSGRDYEIEHRMQRADGSFRWFLSRAVPIRDKKNRVIKWYGTSTDVDDRKKAEEALRKSREELEDRVRERTAELTLTLEDLETSQDNLRKLASELVLTEERERKKISVTLHDEVAQTLAAIRMRIDLLRGMQGNEASRRTLDEAQQLLVQAIRETRSLMTDISNPVLYDMGLKVAIQSLAEDMNARQGVSFSSVFGGRLKNLGQDMEVMIFQVVKELAQNVLKHSGALKASIRVVEERDDIKVVVADDGLGFDVGSIGAVGSDSGFGLFSIRERVKSYNGKIKIESEPGKGSEITVLLPKKAADVAASRRTGKKKQNIQ
ncbi:MAG TPA: PAS domain-containing protein, partial [Syntrophales bacterium]|nr:PAS domain-containing protein [Syntrophales bacterium]